MLGNWNELNEKRMGIMLHYDASLSDAGAVEWLARDPRCKVSYNYLVLDNANIITVAPLDKRAWHAGVCKTSDPTKMPYKDANSAFVGISIAATVGDKVTPEQMNSVYGLCFSLFLRYGWDRSETWRIVGHNTEAWPRGRKIDPEGPDPANPVLSVQDVRDKLKGP